MPPKKRKEKQNDCKMQKTTFRLYYIYKYIHKYITYTSKPKIKRASVALRTCSRTAPAQVFWLITVVFFCKVFKLMVGSRNAQ